ncbi:OCIA domain-containing protein 1 [Oncorhynchus kisutch]|uniref:OCIA domain-containing protein 1 n=1 Tax=Oncorhynchus kisutch TaxID=8019 RepID=A0A8C7CSC8_ONCKI|nr:OCIA domain-containing protein 1 [Oncorhynchus kisutch]
MSQTSMGFTDQQQQGAQSQVGAPYIPTEEEKRVFRECNQESFWYRSLPLTAVAVSVAQALVMKGVLAPSPRFGSLPKVAIAGLFGYIGGKISYTKICQEKFKNLENSPLGEALRQGQRHIPQQFAPQNPSELGDPNQAFFEQASQSVAEPRTQADSFSYPSDFSYSDQGALLSPPLSESDPTGAAADVNQPVPPYLDDETPKKRPTLYEDLRSRNRENYEVTLTQKADILLKSPAETPVLKRDVKKNQYGDAWDE